MKGMWKRIGCLGGALLLSFFILYVVLRLKECLPEEYTFKPLLEGNLFHLSLTILALPISIVLWFFRTYDNKMSSFLQASGLLGGTPSQQRMAIIQLMLLKNKEQVFTQEIDKLTQGISLGDPKNPLNLSNLDLKEINFSNANLLYVNFEGANLFEANFEGAKFANVRLYNVDLKNANFKNSDFVEETERKQSANVQRADLQGADLRGADLRKTNLHEAILKGALWDNCTEFPQGFETEEVRNKRGMIYKP